MKRISFASIVLINSGLILSTRPFVRHGSFIPTVAVSLETRVDAPSLSVFKRSPSVNTVATPRVEAFYWVAITLSRTLGTALGDWAADTGGLGYEGGALIFAAGLAVIAALYFWTSVSRVMLFWAAFILTRPLGATVGDFLDKPVSHGGLALSRPLASAVIAAFIIVCLSVFPQPAGRHPGDAAAVAGE